MIRAVAGQTMRLEEAGAAKVFTNVMAGKAMVRPGLVDLLAYGRPGDTLAVVRLDRLGRSLGELHHGDDASRAADRLAQP